MGVFVKTTSLCFQSLPDVMGIVAKAPEGRVLAMTVRRTVLAPAKPTASSVSVPEVGTCGAQSQEVEVLAQVAAALRVPPSVVELKIFEWGERLRSGGRALSRESTLMARARRGGSGSLHKLDSGNTDQQVCR